MPTFVDLFAASVRRERDRLAALFGPDATDAMEAALRAELHHAWFPWPAGPPAAPRGTFAVDGSQAIRHFNNGWTLLICQALAVGPGLEAPSVEVRFLRSALPEVIQNRYAGLLMRLLEVRAALGQVEAAAGCARCCIGWRHRATRLPRWPSAETPPSMRVATWGLSR